MFSFVQLYADKYGATASEQGILLSFRNIISFSGQQLFGRLSDKHGRLIILLFGFILSSVTTFLLIKAITPLLIIIVFAFYSLGFSAITPAFNALIGDSFERKERVEKLGIITAVGGIIGGVIYLIAGVISEYMVDAYIFLFTIAGISFIFASIVVIIFSKICIVPKIPEDNGDGVSLLDPLRVGFFRKFVLVDALFGLAMSTSWPLFPQKTNSLATSSQVAIMWFVVFVGFSISARYTSQIKDRIGSFNRGFFYSRILMFLVPLSFAFATSWVHLIYARAIAGLTFGYYTTLQKDYILESVNIIDREGQRGLFLGTHAFLFGITTFIGSLVFGNLVDYVVERTNYVYDDLFIVSAAIRFVLAFGFLKIPDLMNQNVVDGILATSNE